LSLQRLKTQEDTATTTTAVTRASASEEKTSVRALVQKVTNNYVVRRVLLAFAKILIVVSLTFFLIRLMPTNPVDVYVNELVQTYGMSAAEARNQAAALLAIDLNAPLSKQYVQYMEGLAHGNLGTSFRSKGTPVNAMIAKFLPWTLFSVGTALLISFSLGMLLGMWAAYRRESLGDHAITTVSSVFSSVPNYLVGIMLVVLLGVQWKLLPITRMRGSLSPGMQPGFNPAFVGDIFFHAALPIATYVLTTVGGWALAMKSSTIATLGEDYVTVAKARGLSERRIMTGYVGRNASLPLFTSLAISIGFIVGGSILIEFIFVYQGIGQLLLNSIQSRDYPVMQGIFLIITIAVILANLLAEFLYSRLDPRVRAVGGK
jgi:peptide/nickel transport system permease protein